MKHDGTVFIVNDMIQQYISRFIKYCVLSMCVLYVNFVIDNSVYSINEYQKILHFDAASSIRLILRLIKVGNQTFLRVVTCRKCSSRFIVFQLQCCHVKFYIIFVFFHSIISHYSNQPLFLHI
jgi:hypothetical protein